MRALVKNLIRLVGSFEVVRFDAACKKPRHTQDALLFKILRQNAKTAFGQAHAFSKIRDLENYRAQVPIADFEGFRAYVSRVEGGEKNVLTKSAPRLLLKTSGTTGEPKYIPVTADVIRQELHLISQWYYRSLKDHPSFLDHARIAIVSSAVEGKTKKGILYGSASGALFQCIPKFIRKFYAIPEEVSEINDYESRYFVIARFALSHKVSFFLTPNPSTLIRLAEVIQKNWNKIITAIDEGKLGIDLPENPLLAKRLEGLLKPNPKRARFLSGKIGAPLSALWPELKLLGCWLGGSVGLQAQRLSSYYGNIPVRDLGYMASEGHFTLPHQDQTPSGILTIQTNYYEFVPEEFHGSKDARVLSCNEVEKGKRYALIITTASGLYRYDINDIVEITGFHHKTPIISFVRKGQEMANITGEKMHANHLILAVKALRQLYELPIKQFRARPDTEKNRYSFYLELTAQVAENHLKEAAQELDRLLCESNVEYAQKRQSGRLKPLCVHLMRPGWSEDEYERSIALTQRDVQYKWKVLCPEPSQEDTVAVIKIIDPLLSDESF